MKRCDECGYEWEERVEKPVECPECKSRDWDKKNSEKEDNENG